jgi:nitrite reductase/ring-hydroxylating ferredoxin subunit
MLKFRFLLVLLVLFTAFSCSKDNMEIIPDVPVNFSASLQFQLPKLQQPGGIEIVTNTNIGIAGLVLYKNSDGRILAYDRCSSVNPIQRNPVTPIGGSLVEDKVSGALFNLVDGSAAKAPAQFPLKRYNVSLNGDLITVQN